MFVKALQYSNFENRYELIEDLSLKSFIEQINEKIIENVLTTLQK